MDRLTKRTGAGMALDTMTQGVRNDSIARGEYIQSVFERLAQYEDIGLTPDEAMRLKQVALGNTESVTDEDEKGELKLCPFCGGEVFLDDEGDFCMVCCRGCGAGTTFAEKFEDGTAGDMNEIQSVKAWNTRKEFDHLQQENGQMKELLGLCKLKELLGQGDGQQND